MSVPDTREARSLEVIGDPEPEPGERGRRWWIPVTLLLLLGGGALAWYTILGGAEEAPDTTAAAELSFADVAVTDLTETSEYDGTLGRLEGDPVSVRLEGTVTGLPEEGRTLEQGDVVAWIDNQPVVLLYGDLPVWREMREDTEGPDVLQLENALTELGFNENEESMTVDETFSAATASVVETWQESIGAEDDGIVGIGEVVFSTAPVRVSALQVSVGDQVGSGTPIFTTSSDEIEVSFDLPTFEADNVEVGAQVEVQLPDLSTTTGIVTEIATTAELSEDGGDATFPVTVELDDPSVAEGIVDAPVTVAVITDQVRGVTAVPVEALVALAEGGYAVEVDDGSGTRLVAVEPGFFAEGLVEISGETSPGDKVVVP
jgi:peptidoglycan hydrolase-like protein with peptidoglycan-binding domain